MILSAAAIAAALGLGACSADTEQKQPEAATATSATSPLVQEPPGPPGAPLPPPEALSDVMNRIADANIPGAEKDGLIESGTQADATAMDKFGQALIQNGYAPATFEARDLRWVQDPPGTVSALISLKTGNPQAGDFSFPMEFVFVDNSWQLTRKTADELLQPGESAGPQTPSGPAPPSPPR
ncbi:hypothetical protein [Mycobacterium sp. 29Ha]|uniref:hypothetical protein n=1 Tax=Mycobacterium sp. 29Ha TaxID=2939268 RepID=UPI002938D56B|nr:hypothetical protein [Mycobacterium sp. 29Ha]MDV3135084.1 hypothetical protein [Mycobacterium sp. 29Ha]